METCKGGKSGRSDTTQVIHGEAEAPHRTVRDVISLSVKTIDHHSNCEGNHCFCNIKPKGSLYEIENDIPFCHDLLRSDFSPARSVGKIDLGVDAG
jgi:hypothetical protein